MVSQYAQVCINAISVTDIRSPRTLYIIFYNTMRPHRYNNYKSPDDAEKVFVESTL